MGSVANMEGDGQSRKSFRGQGCQTDRYTLKPSIFPSVKVKYWKIAVGQEVKVPSPDINDQLRRMLHAVEDILDRAYLVHTLWCVIVFPWGIPQLQSDRRGCPVTTDLIMREPRQTTCCTSYIVPKCKHTHFIIRKIKQSLNLRSIVVCTTINGSQQKKFGSV